MNAMEGLARGTLIGREGATNGEGVGMVGERESV